MGRTELLTLTIRSEPRLEMRKTIHESEMALFFECMRSCAHRVLDIADIVRDGDDANYRACLPDTSGARFSCVPSNRSVSVSTTR
jgi:hypothetical protein